MGQIINNNVERAEDQEPHKLAAGGLCLAIGEAPPPMRIGIITNKAIARPTAGHCQTLVIFLLIFRLPTFGVRNSIHKKYHSSGRRRRQ